MIEYLHPMAKILLGPDTGALLRLSWRFVSATGLGTIVMTMRSSQRGSRDNG